jgi:hypothetical protein
VEVEIIWLKVGVYRPQNAVRDQQKYESSTRPSDEGLPKSVSMGRSALARRSGNETKVCRPRYVFTKGLLLIGRDSVMISHSAAECWPMIYLRYNSLSRPKGITGPKDRILTVLELVVGTESCSLIGIQLCALAYPL